MIVGDALSGGNGRRFKAGGGFMEMAARRRRKKESTPRIIRGLRQRTREGKAAVGSFISSPRRASRPERLGL